MYSVFGWPAKYRLILTLSMQKHHLGDQALSVHEETGSGSRVYSVFGWPAPFSNMLTSKFFPWLAIFANNFRDKDWVRQAGQLFTTATFDDNKNLIDCLGPGAVPVVLGRRVVL